MPEYKMIDGEPWYRKAEPELRYVMVRKWRPLPYADVVPLLKSLSLCKDNSPFTEGLKEWVRAKRLKLKDFEAERQWAFELVFGTKNYENQQD